MLVDFVNGILNVTTLLASVFLYEVNANTIRKKKYMQKLLNIMMIAYHIKHHWVTLNPKIVIFNRNSIRLLGAYASSTQKT
jgi:hypothetical protein